MRRFIISSVMLLVCSTAFAKGSVTFSGGWLHTPNSNYGDAGIAGLRLETPLFYDVSAGIETNYHFATKHWIYGTEEGEDLMPEVIWYLPIMRQYKLFLLGGIGESWWHFNDGQYLKDNDITVKLGRAIAHKVGVGASYPIAKDWSITVEWDYFQASVPKSSFKGDSTFANVVGGKTVGEEETNLVFGIRKDW